MADTVTTKVVLNTPKKLVVHLTNLSDGTGESAVAKVDKSAYTGLNGLEPSKLVVERIEFDVSSMRVSLLWDQTSDEQIAVLQGSGFLDWRDSGGLIGANTGGPGDILLTTTGHAAGDGYDITLYLRKKD
jgi:hypothetical protein